MLELPTADEKFVITDGGLTDPKLQGLCIAEGSALTFAIPVYLYNVRTNLSNTPTFFLFFFLFFPLRPTTECGRRD